MTNYLIFENSETAASTVPINKIRKIRVDKVVICLARTRDGFVAFETECPHQSYDLSKGAINAQLEIVCPWHAYRFSLITGECDRPCRDLKIYKTYWEAGQLFVSM